MAPLKQLGDLAEFTRSDGVRVYIRCQSHSLTNGKVRRTRRYTAATVDWVVVYDATTEACYRLSGP